MKDQGDRSVKRDDHFRALYEQGYPAVLRYAARRVGAEDARDIAAETFMIAWRRLDRVPAHEPLPWLYATARRCLANELRSRGRRDRLDAQVRAEASTGAGAACEGVADGFAGGLAERLDVLTALATLRPNDQEALRLIEWEQLDYAAAAQVAGCSTTAFKVRLHRARRRLVRALDVLEAAPDAIPATSSPMLRLMAAEAAARVSDARLINMGTVSDRAGHTGIAIGYEIPAGSPAPVSLQVLIFDPGTGALLGQEFAYCKGKLGAQPTDGQCFATSYDQMVQIAAVPAIPASPPATNPSASPAVR